MACPVCDAALDPTVLERSGISSLFQCPSCDLQVWEPRTNPGGVYYDTDPHYLASPFVDWLGWTHETGLRAVSGGGRTLLDVGSGDGRFVYAAAERLGIDARGIDISDRLVELGNRQHGGERLEQVELDDHLARHLPGVDAVTMFEVVEHVEWPLAFVRSALRAVRPGGTVVISTPNRHGFPHPEKGYDDPPHHLTRWSPRALLFLATRAGIEDARVEICPAEVGIKAFLLSRVRLGLAVRLLRRNAQSATAAGRSELSTDAGAVPIRSLILAKDRAAGLVARVLAPFIGRFFPGPAMVLIGRARTGEPV